MARIVELTPTEEIQQVKAEESTIAQELAVLRKLGVIETFSFVGTETEGDEAFEKYGQENFGNQPLDKVPDFLLKGLDAKIAADGQTDRFREELKFSGHQDNPEQS